GGGGEFGIDEEGYVIVARTKAGARVVDLAKEVEDLTRKGVTTPLLLRFPQLLESQVKSLCNAFRKAIGEYGYTREYKPVFPIKVNQHRFVVHELLESGCKYNLGLEVGSKPELLGALALETPPDSLLICNGFKDMAYLSNAILAQKIGKNVVIVVEKPYELDHLIQIVRDRGVKPSIGFRVRL